MVKVKIGLDPALITNLRVDGDDAPVRAHLCNLMDALISESRDGEIALADFTERLEFIYKLAHRYLFVAENSNNQNHERTRKIRF